MASILQHSAPIGLTLRRGVRCEGQARGRVPAVRPIHHVVPPVLDERVTLHERKGRAGHVEYMYYVRKESTARLSWRAIR